MHGRLWTETMRKIRCKWQNASAKLLKIAEPGGRSLGQEGATTQLMKLESKYRLAVSLRDCVTTICVFRTLNVSVCCLHESQPLWEEPELLQPRQGTKDSMEGEQREAAEHTPDWRINSPHQWITSATNEQGRGKANKKKQRKTSSWKKEQQMNYFCDV